MINDGLTVSFLDSIDDRFLSSGINLGINIVVVSPVGLSGGPLFTSVLLLLLPVRLAIPLVLILLT